MTVVLFAAKTVMASVPLMAKGSGFFSLSLLFPAFIFVVKSLTVVVLVKMSVRLYQGKLDLSKPEDQDAALV